MEGTDCPSSVAPGEPETAPPPAPGGSSAPSLTFPWGERPGPLLDREQVRGPGAGSGEEGEVLPWVYHCCSSILVCVLQCV